MERLAESQLAAANQNIVVDIEETLPVQTFRLGRWITSCSLSS